MDCKQKFMKNYKNVPNFRHQRVYQWDCYMCRERRVYQHQRELRVHM